MHTLPGLTLHGDAITDAARAALVSWLAPAVAAPGTLPPGAEIVQSRLIRTVARAVVPEVGAVFVKTMAFPRAKDRLRYAFRAVPAVHEARLLEFVAAEVGDVPCPEPLAVVSQRSWRGPRLSILVTRALDVDAHRTVELPAMARIAARLATAGLAHPDLHVGNFVALADGRTAVLDLQSARRAGHPLGVSARRAMAAKLLEDAPPGDPAALVACGLVTADELEMVVARAARQRERATRARILRCLRQSTEFAVRYTGRGRQVLRRRAAGDDLHAVPDVDALDLWLGDRTREVLEGRPPLLAGAFFKWPWLPGRDSVYIAASRYGRTGIEQRRELIASFARYRELCSEHLRPRSGSSGGRGTGPAGT